MADIKQITVVTLTSGHPVCKIKFQTFFINIILPQGPQNNDFRDNIMPESAWGSIGPSSWEE